MTREPASLHDIAPRLARARDQELAYRRRLYQSVVTMTNAMERLGRAQRQFAKSAMAAAAAMEKLRPHRSTS